MHAVADDARLWERFRAVARGDDAWPALMAALEPELAAMARRAPIGRLRGREDSPRDIVTRVFERLHARDFAAIRKLCAMEPPPELRAWLRVLVRRVAIDYLRASPEFERATPQRGPDWVSLATLFSLHPAQAPSSLAGKRELAVATVREMVGRAAAEVAARGDDAYTHLALEWHVPRIHVRRLATRGDQMLAVLVATLAGHTQSEIAGQLALSRREVELAVRYVEELLADRFRDARAEG
jgi:DNA-directed RNA polymerase specialized sigma24 family protein